MKDQSIEEQNSVTNSSNYLTLGTHVKKPAGNVILLTDDEEDEEDNDEDDEDDEEAEKKATPKSNPKQVMHDLTNSSIYLTPGTHVKKPAGNVILLNDDEEDEEDNDEDDEKKATPKSNPKQVMHDLTNSFNHHMNLKSEVGLV